MQTLPEALENLLRRREHVELHHNTRVKSLTLEGGVWEVRDGHSKKLLIEMRQTKYLKAYTAIQKFGNIPGSVVLDNISINPYHFLVQIH